MNGKNMQIVDLKEIPGVIPMLAKWHHEEWAHLNPNTSLEQRIANYQEYLEEGLVPSTFVACENGTVTGSAAIIKHDLETRMEYSPWLASVYVHPEYRETGIGSKLVSHVMAMGERNNLDALYLFTPDKEGFYKRLGWSTIHNESYHNTDIVIMTFKYS